VLRYGRHREKEEKQERNDRIVAIEEAHDRYLRVWHVDELGKKFGKALEAFFANDPRLDGNEYKVLNMKDYLKRFAASGMESKV
jgi:hypothetical protein